MSGTNSFVDFENFDASKQQKGSTEVQPCNDGLYSGTTLPRRFTPDQASDIDGISQFTPMVHPMAPAAELAVPVVTADGFPLNNVDTELLDMGLNFASPTQQTNRNPGDIDFNLLDNNQGTIPEPSSGPFDLNEFMDLLDVQTKAAPVSMPVIPVLPGTQDPGNDFPSLSNLPNSSVGHHDWNHYEFAMQQIGAGEDDAASTSSSDLSGNYSNEEASQPSSPVPLESTRSRTSSTGSTGSISSEPISGARKIESAYTQIDNRWPPEVLSGDVKAFNKYIKHANLSDADEKQLRRARRRYKNRIYAKRSRSKKRLGGIGSDVTTDESDVSDSGSRPSTPVHGSPVTQRSI